MKEDNGFEAGSVGSTNSGGETGGRGRKKTGGSEGEGGRNRQRGERQTDTHTDGPMGKRKSTVKSRGEEKGVLRKRKGKLAS